MAKLKIYAYKIENERLSKPHSDFTPNLIKRLGQPENASKRFMQINLQVKDYDLLSYFVCDENKGEVFGMMMRIAASKDIASFPENYFDREQISPQDLASMGSVGDSGFVCKDSYYFMVNNTFLVTTQPKTRIASFRTYMNWFLELVKMPDEFYKFSIMIEAPEGTQMKDIKEIAFSDYGISRMSSEMEETRDSLFNLTGDVVKNLFSQINNTKYLIEKKIISAKLVVKFNKIVGKDKEDKQLMKDLSSIITPLADDDAVSVKLKNGKSLKAGQMNRMKEVEIESLNNNVVNEQQLRQEMSAFLSELRRN